jgi:DNA repair exonuclease SbcCD ATPase subunit
MSNSGSKYATLAEAMKEKVQMLSLSVDDSVREKVIEAELKRIDEETKQTIEEIKTTPIDADLTKKQAQADLETAKKEHKRKTSTAVTSAEDEVKEAESLLERAKRTLEIVKERSAEIEENSNLKSQQEYERTISSIGNIEQTLALKTAKASQEGENRKRTLNIELDNLKAKRDAQKEKVECIDKLYNDLKEISLKLGDAGSNKK